MLDPDEKLFSIRDFAACAAKQDNPFMAGAICGALEKIAGEEVYALALKLERELIEAAYAKLPPMEAVLQEMYPEYSQEDIKEWMRKKPGLDQLRRLPQYKQAEAKLIAKETNS